MKLFVRSCLIVSFLLIALSINSTAKNIQPQQKLLFHVSDKENVPMLLRTVQQLYDTGTDPASVKIIVLTQGHGVNHFVNLKSKQNLILGTGKQIANLQKHGVTFEICSFAMINREISHDKLLPGIKHVPNGALARLIELMDEGYKYIRI